MQNFVIVCHNMTSDKTLCDGVLQCNERCRAVIVCHSMTSVADPVMVCYIVTSDAELCDCVSQCDECCRSCDSVLHCNERCRAVWLCVTLWRVMQILWWFANMWCATLIWMIMCCIVTSGEHRYDSVLLCHQWYRICDGALHCDSGVFSDLLWYNISNESKSIYYLLRCGEWIIYLCWLVICRFLLSMCSCPVLFQVEVTSKIFFRSGMY
jgi:hypothetical protein